jgi:hypothetical protein
MGMTTKLGLPENRIVTEKYFEAATESRSHLDFGVGIAASDFVRQTGGSWLIVSNHAVFDNDLHGSLSRY